MVASLARRADLLRPVRDEVASRTLSIGMVGGGLIAQAVHLPNLAALHPRFTLSAIADPSRKVGDALARQYCPARSYLDWRELLDQEALDVLIVCSPPATHAEIVLAALECGLHVFVEKPLCITCDDARRIADRAEEAGRVVQVGYMKRYTDAYRAFAEALPESPEALRLINVVTYDPWMAREPFVPWTRMVHADDVPAAVLTTAATSERDQVERAVGSADDATVRAFSGTFLAALVHDVNLVHGALEIMGEHRPVQAVAGIPWANAHAATATARLPGGGFWHCSWLLLDGILNFRERLSLYFVDGVHELEFPAPYAVEAPIRHSVIDSVSGHHRARAQCLANSAFVAELEHFHDCVVGGVPCRTPVGQAIKDLTLLRDLFVSQPVHTMS